MAQDAGMVWKCCGVISIHCKNKLVVLTTEWLP